MKTATFCLVALLAVSGTATAQSGSSPTPSAGATQAARAQVDLNTAEIPALEALPEIGTDLANAVVSGRPYKTVEDAVRVLKLSPEKMASLRPKVFVSPPKPTASTPRDPRNLPPATPPQTNDGKAISAQEVTERYDRAQAKKDATPKK
jgi:hypothetical protein